MNQLSINVNVKIIFRAGGKLLFFRLKDGSSQLPGGHMEGEEQPLDTLRRELKEEMNYTLDREPTLLNVWTYVDKSKNIHRLTIAYVLDLPAQQDFSWTGHDGEEFDSFMWIRPEEIDQQNFNPRYREVMEQAARAQRK